MASKYSKINQNLSTTTTSTSHPMTSFWTLMLKVVASSFMNSTEIWSNWGAQMRREVTTHKLQYSFQRIKYVYWIRTKNSQFAISMGQTWKNSVLTRKDQARLRWYTQDLWVRSLYTAMMLYLCMISLQERLCMKSLLMMLRLYTGTTTLHMLL